MPTSRPGFVRASFARPIIAALALAIAIPLSASPQTTRAYECSGWNDHVNPPPTVRVLRGNGTVQTVDFRKYVGIVMAAEWPAFYPLETLKAGAVAVKQYAWYYIMNARSWYRTASGACYDVKDNTNDQVFQPETRTPAKSQLDAIAATWGLSLRKDGKFWLTGYRAGPFVSCAADRDGYRIYQHSAFDCGKDGLTREQIQHRYYDPGLTFVWAGTPPPSGSVRETTPPKVAAPKAGVGVGLILGSGSSVVSWTGSDASGIARYELQKSVSGGSWTGVALSQPTATRLSLSLPLGKSARFRVRGTDRVGNTSAWVTGPTFTPTLVQDTGTSVSYAGGWSRQSLLSASGEDLTYTSTRGAVAVLRFTGRTIALVSPVGSSRGSAEIYLDGVLSKTVSLYSILPHPRDVVFSKNYSTSSTHTIKVRVVGTSGHPRVDVDAFLIYR